MSMKADPGERRKVERGVEEGWKSLADWSRENERHATIHLVLSLLFCASWPNTQRYQDWAWTTC